MGRAFRRSSRNRERRIHPGGVTYIGQLYPWKGVDVLVEAMRSIEDAELVIVGGLPPEPDLERLKALATRLSVPTASGFADSFRLPGSTPRGRARTHS